MEMVMLKRIFAFKNLLMKMLMAGSTDNKIHPQIRFRYLLGVSVLKSCYVSDLKLNIWFSVRSQNLVDFGKIL